ncbi:hypothetical protein ACLBWX_17740 [Methylobacterium sp. M6A4_1b]
MTEVQRRTVLGTATEARNLRLLLAVLRTETELVRLRRALSRKYSPDQARAPAGQSDGGRWVSDGGAGRDATDRSRSGRWASLDATDPDSEAPQRTLLDGGGEVLTLRIRSGRGDWEEQHTVVTPAGETRIFENAGETQAIRDGQSGAVLSRTTFSPSGIEAEATAQSAFLPVVPFVVGPAVAATMEAAALLFVVLRGRKDGFGTAMGLTARGYEFDPKDRISLPTPWVGQLDKSALSRACPRSGEVQEKTDEVARDIEARLPNLTAQQFGNALHSRLAGYYQKLEDPDMRAELSLDGTETEARYGTAGTLRLDLYEKTPNNMVCIYDYKTGGAEMTASRALQLAHVARLFYPYAKGIVIVQVKPRLPEKKGWVRH